MNGRLRDFADERLRYLYESHRLRTMRAASEFFDVAPSSVSRQIASLEEELGLALVERGRHSIQLTAAGAMVLDYYRDRLAQREALIAGIDDLRGLRKGHLFVAAGHGLLRMPLIRTLRDYMEHHPGIALTVKSASTREVVALVRDDDAHFGIILDEAHEPRIRTRAVVAQPLCLIAYPGHPLANRTSITLRDLVGQRLVLPEEGFRVRQVLREAERDLDIVLDKVLTASSIQMIVDCVQAEIGVTIIPAGCAEDFISAGRLRAVQIDEAGLAGSKVHLIVRIGRRLPASATTLLDSLVRNTSAES